jgi:hypothetical protein
MGLFNEEKIQKQLKWLVEQIRCMQSSACACDFQEPGLTFNSETGELSVTFVDGTVSTVTLDISSQELITEAIPVILGATEGLGKYKNGDIITPPAEGWTFAQLITDIAQRLLVPNLNPPFLTASLSVTGTREVGENYTATLIATFNRGQIVGKTVGGIWEEVEPQDFRAGIATSYELNGGEPQPSNFISVTRTLVLGTNIFNAKVNFAEGPQPIDSAGNNFSTPLPSGSLTASASVPTLYPYFFGKSSSPITINQTLISSGTKVIASSIGTLNITFNATGEYLWFAIPNTSTSKTKWFVTELNQGNIGGIGDLFNSEVILEDVDSPTLLWENIDYKVYITSLPTSTTGSMQLRNN